MNIDTKRNVVIVGAGLAGLSIGAILAKDREKYNVTVYEKTSVIGGRATCKRVRDYQLDNGIHALRGGNDNPVVKILEMVGKKIDFAIKNSDGIIPTVYRNGKIATAPYTTSSLLSYPFLSVIEKIQLIRFVRKATREQPDRLDNTSISVWLKELGL